MAFSLASAQFIALLITVSGAANVVVEDSPPPHGFVLENSEAGIEALVPALTPLRDMQRQPFMCIGLAPGASLEGELAQVLLTAPVRKFIVASAQHQAIAEKEGLDEATADILLRACRATFPKKPRQ